MREGTLIIDVAIDQGGSVEGARPTTHSDPTYPIDGVTLYAVPNMPSIVANTSSLALSNATYPYVQRLANAGLRDALAQDEVLMGGVNTLGGHVTHGAVAEALQRDCVPLSLVLSSLD